MTIESVHVWMIQCPFTITNTNQVLIVANKLCSCTGKANQSWTEPCCSNLIFVAKSVWVISSFSLASSILSDTLSLSNLYSLFSSFLFSLMSKEFCKTLVLLIVISYSLRRYLFSIKHARSVVAQSERERKKKHNKQLSNLQTLTRISLGRSN